MTLKSNGSKKRGLANSLQARLTIIFLALAILPLLGLSGYSLIASKNALEKRVKEDFGLIAALQAEVIDDWVSQREQDIIVLSQIMSATSMDIDQLNYEHKKAQAQWDFFESIFVVGLDGMTLTNSSGEIADLSDRDYFKQALTGKTAISEPLVSRYTGNVAVVIATPIHGDDGEIIGVMAGSVSSQFFNELLQKTQFGDTGEAYMVTKEGILFTPSRFANQLLSQGAIKQRAELELQPETFGIQQVTDGINSVETYTGYLGNEVLGAYEWIERLGWGLVIEQETSETMADINSLQTILIVVGIAASLLVILIILLVVPTVTKPISRLTQVAHNLSLGDINQTIDIKGKDEIGQLADSFRDMVSYQKGMADVAESLAKGDLTQSVKPVSEKDTLGNAFFRMVNALRESIAQVAGTAKQVATSSNQLATAAIQAGQATNQIAATMQHVAEGTNQQSQAAGQTANSVEQMSRAIEGVAQGAQEQAAAISKTSQITAQLSSAIQQVAANADAVTQSSNGAEKAAQTGNQTVSATITGMDTIRTRVDQSAQKVQEMGQRSQQISLIVETIEDIANQTNLLALNAAIEAARAGEQGKGFAVVADEVRKLAERSSASTKEISALISGIQKTVDEAVKAMDEGSREVDNGVQLASQAGQSLEDILKAISDVNEQAQAAMAAAHQMSAAANELVAAVDSVSAVVEENTAATEQMTANSDEVTHSIENIASVSEENSAAVEEVSASTEEMSAQVQEVTASAQSLADMAKTLQEIVSKFTLPEAGK